MDDFAEKAFNDALNAISDEEEKAWYDVTGGVGDYETILLAVAMSVGISNVNNLCDVATKGGQADVLAEYAHMLILTGFHLGYKARMEGEIV